MASEYPPFCSRYCHRSEYSIRSPNKYYIQACVLGKDVGNGNEKTKTNTPKHILICTRTRKYGRIWDLRYLFSWDID